MTRRADTGPEAGRLVRAIRRCRACDLPSESKPVAVEFTGQRFFLLGQAPGKEEIRRGLPFCGPAGRNLFRWFAEAGMGDEVTVRSRLFFCAVAHCWPGTRPGSSDDRPPSPAMRRACSAHVLAELALVDPDWVVAVGAMAATAVFGRAVGLADTVGPAHRVAWGGRERSVIVLPHPSGLSRWLHAEAHRRAHAEAMQALARAWAETWGLPPR